MMVRKPHWLDEPMNLDDFYGEPSKNLTAKGSGMKSIIGGVLVLAGVVFGVWAGLWWAFVGGIVQIVEAVKADPVAAMDIALGIVRIVFAGAIGTFAAMVLIVPGGAMIKS